MTVEDRKARNREYNKQYRERHRAKIRERQRQWEHEDYARNPEKYRAKGRRFYAEHKDEILQQKRESYPGKAEQLRERSASWRAANPERHKTALQQWRSQNEEQVRQYRRRYNALHPELVKQWKHERRARVAGAPVVERVDRLAIYERDQGRCHICRGKVARENFHLDHLVPIARGGDHAEYNLAVTHPRCNQRRGAGWLPAQLRLAFLPDELVHLAA